MTLVFQFTSTFKNFLVATTKIQCYCRLKKWNILTRTQNLVNFEVLVRIHRDFVVVDEVFYKTHEDDFLKNNFIVKEVVDHLH